MRCVIDTNVIVSGVLFPASNPGRVLDLMLDRSVHTVLSPQLAAEYRTVLKRPKFHLDAHTVDLLIDGLEAMAECVVPSPQATYRSPDSKDQFVIDLAVSRDAAIVTGNVRHFATYPVVLTPAEALKRFADGQG